MRLPYECGIEAGKRGWHLIERPTYALSTSRRQWTEGWLIGRQTHLAAWAAVIKSLRYGYGGD